MLEKLLMEKILNCYNQVFLPGNAIEINLRWYETIQSSTNDFKRNTQSNRISTIIIQAIHKN